MDDFISVVSGMSTLEFPYLLSIKKIPTLIFCIFWTIVFSYCKGLYKHMRTLLLRPFTLFDRL